MQLNNKNISENKKEYLERFTRDRHLKQVVTVKRIVDG